MKSMVEIMAKAPYAVIEREDYGDVYCEQCALGDKDDELLLCDKCDKGFHMKCVRPIVARVPNGSWLCPKCVGRRRVGSEDFVFCLLFNFIFSGLLPSFLLFHVYGDKCDYVIYLPLYFQVSRRRRLSVSLGLRSALTRMINGNQFKVKVF